ncbi:LuxS/MPP-like metallohydrolase [Irpex lacteus]|nr:LuxS/MPP-like metallohydrolase [Irpex lacteus]
MTDAGHKTSEWEQVPATDGIPAYSVYSGEVHKPELDDRDYRVVRLENGILAVLIHDPKADKAASCINVAVGHMQDPEDVPGLAHFCEHMIVKGSEPYPDESDYLSYIYNNGGVQNAGTSAAWQRYWFAINPLMLSGGLQRQAASIHLPLFTADCTAREMNAVDSENKRNLQNDARRVQQLAKSLSRFGHPWTKFGTGNLKSLTEAAKKKLTGEGKPAESEDRDGGPVGRAVRHTLLKWWEDNYCAGRMALCVLGNESIEELTKLVVPLYSLIPDRGLEPRPVFEGPVWDTAQKRTIVFVRTVKEYYEFALVFQIEDQAPLYRTRPASFLAHLLGYEGPGSMHSYLRRRGWILELKVDVGANNPSVTPFTISGRLTRKGYLHYEEVVLTVYNYIALLRSSPLEPYHFAEMKQLNITSFRFKEKIQPQTYVKTIAVKLLDPVAGEPQDILSDGVESWEWDEPAVRRLLDSFRPENGRVMLMAKDHDSSVIGDVGTWEHEKWYGTDYQVRKLSETFINKANQPCDNNELALPKPNPYVPEDLSVNRRDVEAVSKSPGLIYDKPLFRLWHKADDQFWTPKAQVRVHIKSPVAYSTPRNAVLSRLVVSLIEDSLAEVTYDARLAGLYSSLESDSRGIEVTVSGYNDKLHLLLDTVLQHLTDIQFKEDRLKVKKEELEQEYRNYYLGQPSNLALDFMTSFLTTPWWTPTQQLEEIPHVTLADLEWHKRELLRKVHVESLITGNVSEQRALHIAGIVEHHLTSLPLSKSEWPVDRSLLLAQGSNHVIKEAHSNPKEANSALVYYCQFGDLFNIRLRTIVRLIAHVLREPAYSQLRTVEQLGYVYVVTTLLHISTNSIGFSFKIQSIKPPAFVENRVEAFIKDYRLSLASITQEEFSDLKAALAAKLLEKPKNLGEESSRFWSQIESGHYDFLGTETDANAVHELALDEVLDAYDKFLLPGISAARKKLSYHLLSQQSTNNAQVGSAQVVVDDVATFKASLACSAAALPVTPLAGKVVHGDVAGV